MCFNEKYSEHKVKGGNEEMVGKRLMKPCLGRQSYAPYQLPLGHGSSGDSKGGPEGAMAPQIFGWPPLDPQFFA